MPKVSQLLYERDAIAPPALPSSRTRLNHFTLSEPEESQALPETEPRRLSGIASFGHAVFCSCSRGRNSRDLSSPDWTIRSVHLFDLKRVFYFRAPKAAVLHMPTYIKVKSTCHHQPHLGSKSKVTLTK